MNERRFAHRASLALLLAIAAPACNKGAEKSAACEQAWTARAAKIDAATQSLDAAETGIADRQVAMKKSADEIEKKLAAITVAYQDREIYPDKLKGLVAKNKMRLSNMQPLKREPGKPATAIRYDMEFQGEYKNVAKLVAALYEQPKVFLLDRVEVNITDNVKKWAIVKAQGWVYEMPELPPAPPVAGTGTAVAVAQAEAGAPAACAALPTPASAAGIETRRAALAARGDVAKRLDELAAAEARVAARKAIYDELVRRRDDNRAAFTTRSDELVRRAQSAVTLLAELRFKANGEPDWR